MRAVNMDKPSGVGLNEFKSGEIEYKTLRKPICSAQAYNDVGFLAIYVAAYLSRTTKLRHFKTFLGMSHDDFFCCVEICLNPTSAAKCETG